MKRIQNYSWNMVLPGGWIGLWHAWPASRWYRAAESGWEVILLRLGACIHQLTIRTPIGMSGWTPGMRWSVRKRLSNMEAQNGSPELLAKCLVSNECSMINRNTLVLKSPLGYGWRWGHSGFIVPNSGFRPPTFSFLGFYFLDDTGTQPAPCAFDVVSCHTLWPLAGPYRFLG